MTHLFQTSVQGIDMFLIVSIILPFLSLSFFVSLATDNDQELICVSNWQVCYDYTSSSWIMNGVSSTCIN
jgi:hypothetical protein